MRRFKYDYLWGKAGIVQGLKDVGIISLQIHEKNIRGAPKMIPDQIVNGYCCYASLREAISQPREMNSMAIDVVSIKSTDSKRPVWELMDLVGMRGVEGGWFTISHNAIQCPDSWLTMLIVQSQLLLQYRVAFNKQAAPA
nr:hypothetical protein [Cyanobium sp. Morenito 9A2]